MTGPLELRLDREHFLAQHLGGRAEPWADALRDPGLGPVRGAEHVAGLAEALRG